MSPENSVVEEIKRRLEEIRPYIEIASDGVPLFKSRAIELLEPLKDLVIDYSVGETLSEALKWLENLKREVEELREKFRIRDFTYPREFRSFIADPRAHLRKKLFNYVHDLVRERISVEDFVAKASAAVKTSLRTNMRTTYQLWCLCALINMLGDRGFDIVYPEQRYINFDRCGKQKLGVIPPNIIMLRVDKGYVSFFHEAPRPLTWEDTSDLRKVWKFYTALRPDLMVYGGRVMNIVDLSSDPPIKRPDMIIEVKELPDWFMRVRDLRGYLRKPITAEEWRSKWLEGLRAGLADVLGIPRAEFAKRVSEGVSLRVREYKIVQLYKSTYRPHKFMLLSRCPMPSDVVEELGRVGINVVHGIGFDRKNLERVADELVSISRLEACEKIPVPLSTETIEALRRFMELSGVSSIDEAIRRAIEIALRSAASK